MMCRHSLQQCVADRALQRACLLFALMCALARTCGLSTVSSLCRAWIAPRRCRGALSPTRWSLICVLPWPCVRARVFADEKIVSIRRRSRRKLKNCRQRYRPSRRTALWVVACARAFCLALWNSLRARVACDDFQEILPRCRRRKIRRRRRHPRWSSASCLLLFRAGAVCLNLTLSFGPCLPLLHPTFRRGRRPAAVGLCLTSPH